MFAKREVRPNKLASVTTLSTKDEGHIQFNQHKLTKPQVHSTSTKYSSNQIQYLLQMEVPLNNAIQTIDPDLIEEESYSSQAIESVQSIQVKPKGQIEECEVENEDSQSQKSEEELEKWEANMINRGLGKRSKEYQEEDSNEYNFENQILEVSSDDHIEALNKDILKNINSINQNANRATEISANMDKLAQQKIDGQQLLSQFQEFELTYTRVAQLMEDNQLSPSDEEQLIKLLEQTERIDNHDDAEVSLKQLQAFIKNSLPNK